MVVLVAFVSQFSVFSKGKQEDTGRISQGDGDLDGNRGNLSGEGEGIERGTTGINGGLRVTRSSSQ